ncbi:hypothetical protein PGT21_019447 [Puccinia graminis f. sp. tritici]|uniref:Peroxin/Ferlin domain-containing protein n=1 Tax=Puccinia graminis f. sp. tritici TaxID=56615 RepID=A0A5B0Q6A3_PUCGR|nr:hypothetical protein PGT21_019447 [Puccinia graminis f. sp. tritici]
MPMDAREPKRKPETSRRIEALSLGQLSPLLATIDELLSLLTWTHPAGHRAPILLLLIHAAFSLLIRPPTGFVDLLLLPLASAALLALKHHRRLRLLPPHIRRLAGLDLANRIALGFLNLALYLSISSRSLFSVLNTHPRSSLLSFFFLFYLIPFFLFPHLPASPSSFLLPLLLSWNSPPLRWLRKLVSSSAWYRSYGSLDHLDRFKTGNRPIKSRCSYSKTTIEEQQQQAHLQEQGQEQEQNPEHPTSTTTSPSGTATARPEKRMLIIRIKLLIIENQRWDQDHGWSSELTREDTRLVGGQWTDMYGQEVCKPKDIKLPPPPPRSEQDRWASIEGEGGWRWDDREWSVVRPDHPRHHDHLSSAPLFLRLAFGPLLSSAHPAWSVDQHGWTYGDHSWTAFSDSPRFNSFVRKRKWTRVVALTAPLCA